MSEIHGFSLRAFVESNDTLDNQFRTGRPSVQTVDHSFGSRGPLCMALGKGQKGVVNPRAHNPSFMLIDSGSLDAVRELEHNLGANDSTFCLNTAYKNVTLARNLFNMVPVRVIMYIYIYIYIYIYYILLLYFK